MYCLWLDGKKVKTVEQLRENYHLPSLCGYLLGGSLSRWLEAAGDPVLAEKVRQIDLSSDYEAALAELFGSKPELPLFVPEKEAPCCAPSMPCSFSANGSFEYLAGSFVPSGSFALAELGSFSPSSFFFGSFSANNNNNNNNAGSFSTGSFSVGSYSLGSFALGSYTGGSFGLTSFASGSFNLTSFAGGSFGFAVPAADGLSSEKEEAPVRKLSDEEIKKLSPEEKVIVNLSSEPLNRYGYGIHLV